MKVFSFIFENARNSLLKAVSTRTGFILSRPLQVSIEPNERCNARCLMCDCWKETRDFLNADDILNVIRELKEWMGSNFFIQIAGGEPLIFKGITGIFRYCADNRIICKISTNGISLTKPVCDRIIASGLKYLTISIDSHIPEIHDKYRGVKRAFDRAMKGLDYLHRHSDMVLGISSIIMQENVGHLKDFTDFLLGLPVHRIIFQPVRAYGIPLSKWQEYEFWVTDLQALDEGIEYIKARKKEDPRIINTFGHLDLMKDYFRDPKSILNSRKCHIGYEQLNISYKGDVTLCNAFPKIGNIREGSLRAMWTSEQAKEIRKKMQACRFPCTSNCKKEFSIREKIEKFKVFLKAGLFR